LGNAVGIVEILRATLEEDSRHSEILKDLGEAAGAFSSGSPDVFIGCLVMKNPREKYYSQ
jgi:hypothetical protein